MLNYNNEQLKFLDLLNIASFCIGLMNLEENITQGDKQEMMQQLDQKVNIMLKEIHRHLEQQDEKINLIIEKLEVINSGNR